MDTLGSVFADSSGDIDPEIYLDQLRGQLEKRKNYAHGIKPEVVKALDHCIEARLIDCDRVGRGEEARELINSYRA